MFEKKTQLSTVINETAQSLAVNQTLISGYVQSVISKLVKLSMQWPYIIVKYYLIQCGEMH